MSSHSTARPCAEHDRNRPAAPRLVAALDHNAGVVLGQLAITTKSNDIPAVQGLLEYFDLTDVVVTIDAMHTQTDTAAQITDAGGDYVFTVKANQPKLHKGCKALPWKDISATSTPQPRSSSETHAQDCRCPVQRHVHRRSPDRTSTTYSHKAQQEDRRSRLPDHLREPSSRTTSNPCGLVQGHWGIENRIHWVRDVTFDEDRSQVRTRNAPKVMATMRNTAISLLRLTGVENIAQGLRHHARARQAITKLLLTKHDLGGALAHDLPLCVSYGGRAVRRPDQENSTWPEVLVTKAQKTSQKIEPSLVAGGRYPPRFRWSD